MNLKPDPDPIRIQGLNDLKLKRKENTVEISFPFLINNFIFTYVQAIGEAFSLKREHPALFFLYVCGPFLPSWIRIRVRIQGPHWIRIRTHAAFFTQSYIVHTMKTQTLHCTYLVLFLFYSGFSRNWAKLRAICCEKYRMPGQARQISTKNNTSAHFKFPKKGEGVDFPKITLPKKRWKYLANESISV